MVLKRKKKPEPPLAENEVGTRHLSWLERNIKAKTVLSSMDICGQKYHLGYVDRVERQDTWGVNLIEGIALHKVLEEFFRAHMLGQFLTDPDARRICQESIHENWHRLDGPSGGGPGGMTIKIMDVLALWRTYWGLHFDKCLEVEKLFEGYQFGDVKLGGHIDAIMLDKQGRKVIVDYKYVSSQSGHRNSSGDKTVVMDPFMIAYMEAADVERACIVPIVKNLKSGIKIDKPKWIDYNPALVSVAKKKIADLAGLIDMGYSGVHGIKLGEGLCQSRYCPYFARECAYTQGMKRG